MPDIIVTKRVRTHMGPRCANPKCGSKKLHLYRENQHYRAFKCHECGHFAVEGNTPLFCDHETAINQAKMKRDLRVVLMETYA